MIFKRRGAAYLPRSKDRGVRSGLPDYVRPAKPFGRVVQAGEPNDRSGGRAQTCPPSSWREAVRLCVFHFQYGVFQHPSSTLDHHLQNILGEFHG